MENDISLWQKLREVFFLELRNFSRTNRILHIIFVYNEKHFVYKLELIISQAKKEKKKKKKKKKKQKKREEEGEEEEERRR